MKYMLDTNICIYLIKQKPAVVLERFKQTDISEISISSITLSELFYGVSKSSKPEQNLMALTQFAAPLEIMSFGGGSRPMLWRPESPPGNTGYTNWVSGYADRGSRNFTIYHTLVTNNEKEFNRVPNLKIENWVS